MFVLLLHKDVAEAEKARFALGLEGFAAVVAQSADDAISLLKNNDFDAIVVHQGAVNNPEWFLDRVRAHPSAPFVMAVLETERSPAQLPSQEIACAQRVQGLRVGFDDVVEIGDAPSTMFARLRRLCVRLAGARLYKASEKSGPLPRSFAVPYLTFGRLVLQVFKRRCLVSADPGVHADELLALGEDRLVPITLTRRQYDFIEHLAMRADQFVPIDSLLALYDASVDAAGDMGNNIDANNVRMIARKVRTALEPFGLANAIHTGMAYGYKLDMAACDPVRAAA